MRIALLGASGFIGQEVYAQLQHLGHETVLLGRNIIDFSQPKQIDKEQLAPYFAGVDCVINMVGVLTRHQHMLAAVHTHSPYHLAQIAKACGVKRWVNLSALSNLPNPLESVDDTKHCGFIGSKWQGDYQLTKLSDAHFMVAVVRPSLAFGYNQYGKGGASFLMFKRLAQLPILCLPMACRPLPAQQTLCTPSQSTPNMHPAQIQPVHVIDVAKGLVALAVRDLSTWIDYHTIGQTYPNHPNAAVFEFAGDRQMGFVDYLYQLRDKSQKPMKIYWLPDTLMTPMAYLGNYLSDGLISPDSLKLLAVGSTTNHNALPALIGQLTPLNRLDTMPY